METLPVKAAGDARHTSLLASACRMVLKPIIGILLRGGMPYAMFTRIARSVYVEVASEEFGIGGRRTNRSRIAMLTGLSRTQVRQELNTGDDADSDGDPFDNVRHVSRVLLGWHTDADFIDRHGHPLPLLEEGPTPSFAELYERYSGKVVPPTTMLKELRQVGAVRDTDDGRLEVLTRSYTPEHSDPVALKRVLTAVRDLANTGSYNLFRDQAEPARFERFATNQLIPVAYVGEFHRLVEQEGQAFFERVDNWLTGRESRDGSEPVIRVGVGIYQIQPYRSKGKRRR